jgi:GcrA cell cycle regulator
MIFRNRLKVETGFPMSGSAGKKGKQMPIVTTNEGWTETRLTKLKALWASGLTCSQIAAELGGFSGCKDRGRSAVIGKIHRLKLPDPVGKRMPRRGEDRKNWPRPLPRDSEAKPLNRDFRASSVETAQSTKRTTHNITRLQSIANGHDPAPRLRNGYDPALRRNPSHNILAAIAIAGTEPGLPEKLKGEKPDGTGVKLVDLDGNSCRWPKGDPGEPDFEFCGGYALDGLPYCAGHSRIAYLPTQSRNRVAQKMGV